MNHYERLGVELDADFQSLKKAFYRQAKECHPDRFGNSHDKTEEFKLLVIAFDILSDPVKRDRYDLSEGFSRQSRPSGAAQSGNFNSGASIMDSDADDTLEELIVGNRPPEDSRLATLFLDLERTLVFMTFREGRNLYASRRYGEARRLLNKAVWLSPGNILYRVHLARCHAACGEFARAKNQYRKAIEFGMLRVPPQRLDRVRLELEAIMKMQLPWWHGILSLFLPPATSYEAPLEERMIDETNRAIAKIEAEREFRRRSLPPSP